MLPKMPLTAPDTSSSRELSEACRGRKTRCNQAQHMIIPLLIPSAVSEVCHSIRQWLLSGDAKRCNILHPTRTSLLGYTNPSRQVTSAPAQYDACELMTR